MKLEFFFKFDKVLEIITMSESWRQRLSRRRSEIGIEGPEYDYIQNYIEFYCSEADRRCKEIDMHKTVDEVIDSMKDEKFDKFTRSVIDSVHKKQGYDGEAPPQMA
jgi:hypothetical protein